MRFYNTFINGSAKKIAIFSEYVVRKPQASKIRPSAVV
jgi:hypothetical protein